MAFLKRHALLVLSACSFLFVINGCPADSTQPVGHTHEQLFVLNENSKSLFVYDVPELHGPDTIPMPATFPHHLHFNPETEDYYIVSRDQGGTGRAYRLNADTHEVFDSSGFEGLLTGVTTDPFGENLYISDFGTDISQRTLMWKMNPATFTVEQEIQCGSQPHYIEVTEDGETVVVVNAGSDEVTLYYPNGNPEDNVFNVKIDPDPDSARPIGNPKFAPYGLVLAQDDSLAYLACKSSPEADKAYILVFDLKQRQTIDTIKLDWTPRYSQVGAAKYHLGLEILLEDDRYLAVTSQHGNSVYLIDLTDKSYVERAFSANWTFGITATSDERYIYVTASNGGTNPPQKGWVYELERDGGNLTVLDSAQADMLPNGCHVRHLFGHNH